MLVRAVEVEEDEEKEEQRIKKEKTEKTQNQNHSWNRKWRMFASWVHKLASRPCLLEKFFWKGANLCPKLWTNEDSDKASGLVEKEWRLQ